MTDIRHDLVLALKAAASDVENQPGFLLRLLLLSAANELGQVVSDAAFDSIEERPTKPTAADAPPRNKGGRPRKKPPVHYFQGGGQVPECGDGMRHTLAPEQITGDRAQATCPGCVEALKQTTITPAAAAEEAAS